MNRFARDPKKTQLFELADGVLRSWWTISAGLCIGLAAALVALHFTPKVYQATTRILVDVQKLPKEYLTPSTVANETEVRLNAFWDAVMQAPEINEIARDVFGAETTAELEAAIGRIQSNVTVSFLRRDQLLEIGFSDEKPARAAAVANALSNVIAAQYTQYRSERAGEATETLRSLTSAAEEEWRIKQQTIEDYRRRFPQQTADRLPINEELLREARRRLEENLTTQSDAGERLRAFQAQAALSDALDPIGGSPISTTGGSAGSQGRIAVVRRELEEARRRYSDRHPDVVAKRRELEDLERSAGNSAPIETPHEPVPQSPPSAAADIWSVQIAAEQRRIDKLKTEEQTIRSDIALYTRRIGATHEVERELGDLSKDVKILEGKYYSWKNKLELAETAQMLEENQQSSRFEVIEPALPPSSPSWPKPMPFLGIALAASLALFVGPIPLKRLLRPVVGSEAALIGVTAAPFLVSVPSLPTPENIRLGRRRRIRNVGLSALSVVFLVAVVAVLQRI